jgi:mannose-6-phosphate isomerase
MQQSAASRRRFAVSAAISVITNRVKTMVTERARVRALHKPWGASDLRPWSRLHLDEGPIGELLYERNTDSAPPPSLLFKVLATTEPLSIQVHPNDAFAQKMGLPSGKTEAWYVLSAKPGAKIAIGLKRSLSPLQLREVIEDGSIAGLLHWRHVAAGDTVLIAAGTIHTIGPGIVIAEIQQASDATFRMFDYGRSRALHVDQAVAAAEAGPAAVQPPPLRYSDARTVLINDPHLILEHIALPRNSTWDFRPTRETWLFVVTGSARIGAFDIAIGECVFAADESFHINAGLSGLEALVAYPGPALASELLCDLAMKATEPSSLATVVAPFAPFDATPPDVRP